MSLVGVIVALVLIGLALWILGQFPIDATISKLIRLVLIVAAVLCVLLFVLHVFGVGLPAMNLK